MPRKKVDTSGKTEVDFTKPLVYVRPGQTMSVQYLGDMTHMKKEPGDEDIDFHMIAIGKRHTLVNQYGEQQNPEWTGKKGGPDRWKPLVGNMKPKVVKEAKSKVSHQINLSASDRRSAGVDMTALLEKVDVLIAHVADAANHIDEGKEKVVRSLHSLFAEQNKSLTSLFTEQRLSLEKSLQNVLDKALYHQEDIMTMPLPKKTANGAVAGN